jgi:hypothetical protein
VTLQLDLPVRYKAPGAERIFRWNLTKYLNGDTISTLDSVVVSPSGGVEVLDQTLASPRITVKLGGGTLGQSYIVTAKFTPRGRGEGRAQLQPHDCSNIRRPSWPSRLVTSF